MNSSFFVFRLFSLMRVALFIFPAVFWSWIIRIITCFVVGGMTMTWFRFYCFILPFIITFTFIAVVDCLTVRLPSGVIMNN
jgi:hypothetical protein